MRAAPKVILADEDRRTLVRWSRGRSTPARLARRAHIVLQAAEGRTNVEIAAKLGIDRTVVNRWRRRFAEQGLAGIAKDAPRPGRPATQRAACVRRIIEKTTREQPAHATHWTTRTLARELGVSQSMVHRVWKAHGLKPHLTRTFRLSRDPHFIGKMMDIVGLYLNPPEHALVLSVDEKSQIQALDRTQPCLPLKRGRCQPFNRTKGTFYFCATLGSGGCFRGRPRGHVSEPQGVPRFTLRRRIPRDCQSKSRMSPYPILAPAASPLSHSLHADQPFVAEPRRAVVPGSERQAAAAGQLSERATAGQGHHRLHRASQPPAQTVRVHGQGRRHSRQDPAGPRRHG